MMFLVKTSFMQNVNTNEICSNVLYETHRCIVSEAAVSVCTVNHSFSTCTCKNCSK